MPFTFSDIELREFGGRSATNNIAACALRGVETPSRRTMPLQNRVNPFGELCNFPARGLFMGNRGGRFHADAKTLTARRWASRQWICCVLNFKGRRREIWGRSYTELFFLDEPTALAAGHRPCFECRRQDAQAFAEKWREVHRYRKPPYAAEIDNVLHAERLQGHVKRLHRRNVDELPDGSIAAFDGAAFAIRGDALLHWTPGGYRAREQRPRRIAVDVLTPPAIIQVLSAGYEPRWHSSAKD